MELLIAETSQCPVLAGSGGLVQAASALAMLLSVQTSPKHHLSLSQGIEQHFPASYDPRAAERLSGFSSDGISAMPWYDATYACHRLKDLGQ